MFEQASREKLRFNTQIGILTVEDLWGLTLVQLDTIAKSLNKKIKESEEESFIKESSNADKTTKLQFEIVKHIIETKLTEQQINKEKKEKLKQKQVLLELLERKQLENQLSLSEDELIKKISELS